MITMRGSDVAYAHPINPIIATDTQIPKWSLWEFVRSAFQPVSKIAGMAMIEGIIASHPICRFVADEADNDLIIVGIQ